VPPGNRSNTSLENPLPQNLDAERAILGSILLGGWDLESKDAAMQAVVVAAKELSSGDFFLPQHKIIFRTCVEMASSSMPIDFVTIIEELYKRGQLAEAGGNAYIASLVDGVPKSANIQHYSRIVREKAALRNLIHSAHAIQRRAFEPDANLAALETQFQSLSVSSSPVTQVGANGHMAYGLTEFLAAKFPDPEHLIEIANERGEAIAGLLPSNSTSMVFSMPHNLKSWFTTSLALACTTKGIKFGKLLVKKPVRTYLIQMEDFPGQLQWRIRQLAPFMDIDPENFAALPRTDHNGNKINVTLPDAQNAALLKREFDWFKPDLVIFDVLRRIVNIDLNSPKDSALFLEQMDSFRYCVSQPHLMLVHHENRKEADIMYASAGSYNLPGWANVMMQFKRKREENGVSHVEIEVDNKLAQSPEPMRMVLNLKSETPVRLENVEDTTGLEELRNQLGSEWTVRDLAEVMNVHKSNANRRLKKFQDSGVVQKVCGGKRGRTGGLARFRFVGEGE
jgi:DnaB-like helicase N terminal domain/AAA domain